MYKYFKYTAQWLLTNVFAYVASSPIEIQCLITLEESPFSSLSKAVFTGFSHLRLVLLVLGPISWTICCVLTCLESHNTVVSFLLLFKNFQFCLRQGLIVQHRLSITCQSGQDLPRAEITGLYHHTSPGLCWTDLLCTCPCVSVGVSKGVFWGVCCVRPRLCQVTVVLPTPTSRV